ncbi:L-fuculose-phosphate aldolase [Testudinibacter sp. TR-2022]|uniref:L-fuculose-phosphate aldolase n=1 Tax=Testudinibacter sp. TR-2022 TaxID=2585029 RepID=UPI00111A42C0|nr:L-fuculose-phosphate aldolase [Testudinibacter sp. TR-2022]TNH03249.1 L-fuculose-phosphate aldolase [Pasteurellaceae bacterium Phil31]TNH10916.1 L-fuculose-phosphate aldolase [Testudinibacter sp. TR-2022]TNH12283.1 L-fuculose-phosphate aldolase [Testudinibacter sp. TR-2022]TNH15021.1 L-fuculose-phosphate aldolase [Testudinibacter sp. TR-2022]TNH20496.1 L-fuculose-phosphate aldolase [Testudinibacter sp. TR-2022]
MNRQALSREIIDTCLEMTHLGLNQGTAGNVSARYNGGMLITPSGMPYEQMNEDCIVFVDGDGHYEAGKLPSSEWRFHHAVYQARPDLDAVVHNHAIHCSAVSILGKAIPAIHYMVAVGGTDHIPCVPYATFGTPKLAEYVQQGIQQSKAILLQHHGLIAAEKNLRKALWLAHEVEVLATWYIQLLAITDDVPVLSPQEIQVVLGKFSTYGLRIEE